LLLPSATPLTSSSLASPWFTSPPFSQLIVMSDHPASLRVSCASLTRSIENGTIKYETKSKSVGIQSRSNAEQLKREESGSLGSGVAQKKTSVRYAERISRLYDGSRMQCWFYSEQQFELIDINQQKQEDEEFQPVCLIRDQSIVDQLVDVSKQRSFHLLWLVFSFLH